MNFQELLGIPQKGLQNYWQSSGRETERVTDISFLARNWAGHTYLSRIYESRFSYGESIAAVTGLSQQHSCRYSSISGLHRYQPDSHCHIMLPTLSGIVSAVSNGGEIMLQTIPNYNKLYSQSGIRLTMSANGRCYWGHNNPGRYDECCRHYFLINGNECSNQGTIEGIHYLNKWTNLYRPIMGKHTTVAVVTVRLKYEAGWRSIILSSWWNMWTYRSRNGDLNLECRDMQRLLSGGWMLFRMEQLGTPDGVGDVCGAGDSLVLNII